MKNKLLKLLIFTFTAGHAISAENIKHLNDSISGIDTQNIDLAIRPQDDFYRYVNGKWLEKTQIPADKSAWGAFYEVNDNTLNQLHSIVESLEANGSKNATEKKIADLYKSFMNEALIESKGLDPILPVLNHINEIARKDQLPSLIAHLNKIGVDTPYVPIIHQDARNSSKVIVDIYQSGLGLPDRDYYLKKDDLKLSEIRAKYLKHIEKLLSMSGDKLAHQDAIDILELETKLAGAQWTKVENRDPIKGYNKVELTKLSTLTPHYKWNDYLTQAGLKQNISYVIISQPSYLSKFDQITQTTPLKTWIAYYKWKAICAFAPLLSKSFVDENFAFYGTVLTGAPIAEPRWKRGINLIEQALGEGLGQLYVSKYFPPQNKALIKDMIVNIMTTYKQSIAQLDWMSSETKAQAQKKLATMMLKIAYPDKWRDYSGLVIESNDLVGNVIRSNMFGYDYQISKLGKPVDRAKWDMTPQTVNAYYNSELNEIVFPAAILQPPFFNAKADSAVNYGGIGAVIAHEISHAFDDQGSQYDEIGNLRNWWTESDHARFAAKTKQLVEQYGSYSPLPGYKINGELTLGENIADNSGLAIAYKAYELSLKDQASPVIDNTSGEQRLYEGWAQVWRIKMRKEQEINMIKVDPHSPGEFRSNGTLQNQPGFYKAFDVKPGDKMYLDPNKRVTIW